MCLLPYKSIVLSLKILIHKCLCFIPMKHCLCIVMHMGELRLSTYQDTKRAQSTFIDIISRWHPCRILFSCCCLIYESSRCKFRDEVLPCTCSSFKKCNQHWRYMRKFRVIFRNSLNH